MTIDQKTFAFSSYGTLIGLAVLLLALPVAFAPEILKTGHLDLFVGHVPSSILPRWASLAVTLVCAAVFWRIFFRYAFAYLRRRYIFKLSGEAIFVDDVWIARSDIKHFEWRRLFNDLVIVTDATRHVIHPTWATDGKPEIEAFLAPLKPLDSSQQASPKRPR